MLKLTRRLALLAAAFAALQPAAHAQDAAANYPNKPIRFIVAFPPGGGTDALARLVGQALSKSLGQPIVIENRAGASGLLAAQAVAVAPADGYTLLIGGSGPMVFQPIVMGNKMPYDSEKDLSAVTILGSYPLVIVAKNNLPVKNVTEMVQLAKSKPGALSYGHPGVTFQVPMEFFSRSVGIKLLSVPYKGGAPASADLMAGSIDLMMTDLTSVANLHNSGKMRALAVTSHKRSTLLPEVPTLAEAGYLKDFEVTAFTSLGAPGGTPPAIVNKLQREVAKVLQSPEIRERLSQMGIEPGGKSPEETVARYRHEISVYRPIARDAGLIEKQ
ncbi:MAG: tripartite tricarboxylate transporter substrate binding protein [Burkholderiaceae bacterium]|nr:tripartite tricarboxylate transporter substrate binding protein [Burkholderiaceae bacterium]